MAEYVANNKKINCVDLALSLLIDYASENGLALNITTADGRSFDSNSDTYNSIDDFKYGVMDENGKRDKSTSVLGQVYARDISPNTYTLDKTDASFKEPEVYE